MIHIDYLANFSGHCELYYKKSLSIQSNSTHNPKHDQDLRACEVILDALEHQLINVHVDFVTQELKAFLLSEKVQQQKEALKIAFALDPYPSTAAMDYLSQELNLESRSISNWFHNHRMRLKQQLPQGMDRIAPLLNKNGSNSSGGAAGDQHHAFDPIKFKLIFHQRLLEMQQGQTGADDGGNGSNVSGVSMSALMMRQFGYAPLMGLGGDLSSIDSMLARTASVGSGMGEEGIIPGGGVAYIRAATSLDEESGENEDECTGIKIVKRAIEDPLRTIVENAGGEGAVIVQKVKEGKGDFGYNARTDKYESLMKSGVIDPTKVSRSALENAASIASMMLTTECVISDEPEDEAPMPPMGGGMPGGMPGMM